MNIIYLGKFFPQTLLRTINEDCKVKMGMSNHNFEMSILNGLCQQEGIELKCITIPGVYSYPHNNKNLYTKPESYDYKNTHIDSAGFCNLVGIKEKCAARSCARLIVKATNSFVGDDLHIIINTPDIRLFDAVRMAERKTKKRFTKTVIIPDIPSMVTAMDKQNPIKAYLLAKRDFKVMEYTANSNGLVLLTEAMMDYVSKPVKHIVMEGIVDVSTMDMKQVPIVTNKEVILYTGTLRKIFGVMNLVNAFRMVHDKNVELWICGSGDSEEAIEEAARKDSRIKFFGLVDSKTALEMQHKATILVNPRTSEGKYTRYSFPSKTMEYLLAGRSVIINRLPGIPEEYYDYVYTPKDESVDAFAECISNVIHIDKDIREKRSESGRRFIIEKKNSKIQMERVIKMIQSYQ